MTIFTLYETLNTEIPNKDLLVSQKNKLIEIISKLDTKELGIVYALIKQHSILNSTSNEMYKHTITKHKEGLHTISWNLTDIPIQLRQILFKFACLEEQRIIDSEIRIDHQLKMKKKLTKQK